MVDVDICTLSLFNEELAWAVGKQLWVISTTKLFKELAVLNLKQHCIH